MQELVLCHTELVHVTGNCGRKLTVRGHVYGMVLVEAHSKTCLPVLFWAQDAAGFGDRIVVTWQKQDAVNPRSVTSSCLLVRRWHHATCFSVSVCCITVFHMAPCWDGQQAFWWFFLNPLRLWFSFSSAFLSPAQPGKCWIASAANAALCYRYAWLAVQVRCGYRF